MNQLDHFKKVREELIQAFDDFPKERREEILFDKWSLRQILIHISRWDKALTENLRFLKEEKEPPFYGKVSDFNQESMEVGKSWSWDEAYSEFIKVGEKFIEEYESLKEDQWEKKFWGNKGSTPVKFLQIQIKHYEHEHLPEIRKYLN